MKWFIDGAAVLAAILGVFAILLAVSEAQRAATWSVSEKLFARYLSWVVFAFLFLLVLGVIQ